MVGDVVEADTGEFAPVAESMAAAVAMAYAAEEATGVGNDALALARHAVGARDAALAASYAVERKAVPGVQVEVHCPLCEARPAPQAHCLFAAFHALPA